MSKEISLKRRTFLAGCSALAIAAPLSRAARGAELGEDGLYREFWFLESFLDYRDDLNAAVKAGKTFTVYWELKGCPYCKLLHTEAFAQAATRDYLIANFAVLQLNFLGARPVIDFNGKTYSEKEMALRHEVNSTPTLQFFSPSDGDIGREIGRTGYLKPAEFHQMLRFVHEKGYRDASFDEWAKRNPLQN